MTPRAAALLGAALALPACNRVPAPRGPTTEHWLPTTRTVAVQAPADAVSATTSTSATFTLPGRRWGEPFFSLTEVASGAAPGGSRAVRLRSGGRLRYDVRRANEGRASIGTLEGSLELDGQVWGVRCADYAEDDGYGGADPEWCLPFLGTLRFVDPKP